MMSGLLQSEATFAQSPLSPGTSPVWSPVMGHGVIIDGVFSAMQENPLGQVRTTGPGAVLTSLSDPGLRSELGIVAKATGKDWTRFGRELELQNVGASPFHPNARVKLLATKIAIIIERMRGKRKREKLYVMHT